MAGKLCFLCCRNFLPEVAAAIAAEGWQDVSVAAFEARCGHPPLTWDELTPGEGCTQVVILGRACLQGLGTPPAHWPPVRQVVQTNCFHLVAGAALVDDALARHAYLVTPHWVMHWREQLQAQGFDEISAPGFFHDFARELVLLDTGVEPEAIGQFAQMAAKVGLPATRVAVGLDYVRLLLSRLVAEWRVGEIQKGYVQERADYLAAVDFLGRIALLTDERQAIGAISELFHMLFAPQRFHYVRFKDRHPVFDADMASDLRQQVASMNAPWAWTASGTGFLLRIGFGGETLGMAIADDFAFPQFRTRYLNLALSIAGVCGLAIENARTYRRVKDTEQALRKSERSLTLAQSLAHLGHWEWDMENEIFIWSDETYRIFGYAPEAVTPSRDVFFEVIHPDDRPLVEHRIRQAREGGGRFDLEYRIVLPTGGVRVVRGMGDVVMVGADRQPNIVGAIQQLDDQGQVEILGVVQDITDRKELEWRLEQEARTDALTGCANRRYFMQLAAQEFARVRRYGGDLSVLMLDLDHFKSVNDRYGHHVGDATLQKLVQICRLVLRQGDTVGRLGGEEFAVMLPETGAEYALDAAERLREAVAAAEVPLTGKPPIHFTTSVGVASLAPADESIDALLGRADRALYDAKNAGRNRVVALAFPGPC